MIKHTKVYETIINYLKKTPHYHTESCHIPMMIIKGKYLNRFGFTYGTEVSLEFSENRIVITPIKENED